MPELAVERRRRSALESRRLARAVLGVSVLLGAIGLASAYAPRDLLGAATADAAGAAITIAVPVLAFALGAWFPRWVGLSAVTWNAVAWELDQGYVNPFILVVIFGPWIVGAMIRDRRLIAADLERTAEQLQRESELVAEESVRLERARI